MNKISTKEKEKESVITEKKDDNKETKKNLRNFSTKSFLKKSQKKNKRPSGFVPKTSQATIPIERAFANGMIESTPGYYTKSYKIKDVNFKVAPREIQEKIFLKYESFLNTFDSNVEIQVVLNNHSVDEKEVLKDVLMKYSGDGLDELRRESNDILKEKISEGRNNISNENYIVLGICAKDCEEAKRTFSRIDNSLSESLKAITLRETLPMSLDERIEILHNICNLGNERKIDFSYLKESFQQGLSVKDIIAPEGFDFNSSYFKIGEVFARALYLKSYPSSLSTNFTSDLMALPFNVLTDIKYSAMNKEDAVKLVRSKITNINSNITDARKKTSNPDLIPEILFDAKEEARLLLEDVNKRDQKLIYTSVTILHMAKSLEELDADTQAVKDLANGYMLSFTNLLFQQEQAFVSSLPLGLNELHVKRILTTETAALFFPFSTQEMSEKTGRYYGLNSISKNLILLDRSKLKNQNGLILGQSGTGKSFSAKREMANVLLTTIDDIYVIDPDGEYAKFAKEFKDVNEIVKISLGNGIKLNPFDMDLNYAKSDEDSSDPVAMKYDFICSICETMLGTNTGLNSNQKTIIDRVVRQLYRPYLEHIVKLNSDDPTVTMDLTATPTLDDFYSLLMQQQEPDARNLALSIELYARGSFNNFSGKTNVDTNKRFVVFDISNLGSGLLELGLQICLNHIWNKIISNFSINKKTWLYIDEFYVLLQQEASTKFLLKMFKRVRKFGGFLTGITQNVEDLLHTVSGRGILGNCSFLYILSQAPADREVLAESYNISDELLANITDASIGRGLIYNGNMIIPFEDNFPQNTKLFQMMNTDAGRN